MGKILNKKLNDEEKNIWEEMVYILFNEGCVDARKKFKYGYRLGVFITVEIFTEDKEHFMEWNEQVNYYEVIFEYENFTYGFRLYVILIFGIFMGKESG